MEFGNSALVVLLIYRSIITLHEDDQIFLGEGESQIAGGADCAGGSHPLPYAVDHGSGRSFGCADGDYQRRVPLARFGDAAAIAAQDCAASCLRRSGYGLPSWQAVSVGCGTGWRI